MKSASLIIRATLCLAIAILFAGSPASAWISVENDGADGAPAVLRLQAGIRKGDLAALETALASVDRASAAKINGQPLIKLELDSPGGDVVEAVAIGRLVYQNYIMTAVRPGRECVSACVFVLIAGAVHYPENGASIGVHKPLLVSWSHMSAAQAHAKYDALMDYLRDYFAELGVADSAYDIMMRTRPEDLRYFSPAELDQLRLRGEDPAWKALYAERSAARAAKPVQEAVQQPPALPQIDESWRDLVVMPGANDEKIATIQEAEPQPPPPSGPKFIWTSVDPDRPGLFLWTRTELVDFLRRLWSALVVLFGPVWWLLALVSFEILRARPWPGDPWDRHEDQWRLKPLRGEPV